MKHHIVPGDLVLLRDESTYGVGDLDAYPWVTVSSHGVGIVVCIRDAGRGFIASIVWSGPAPYDGRFDRYVRVESLEVIDD